MNDVLPKPFTKEGLLLMLQDQLKHLVRIGNIMPPGAMPSHFAFSASQHAHPDSHQSLNDGPAPNNGNNNIKYSVSPAPSKSPVTAGGLYGSGRSPAELGDDVAAQVHPTSGMDDPGGYVDMMGGYMPEEGSHRGFQPPPGSVRRPAEDDIYGQIKKPRY